MVNVSDKARYILRRGRVEILAKPYQHMRARVGGEHGVYFVEIFRDGRFNCQCENFTYDNGIECSHALAVKMHPDYRDWWALRRIGEQIILDEAFKAEIPKFRLEPLKIPPARTVTGGGRRPPIEGDEETKFVRRLRFEEGKTYSEIIRALEEEYGLRVSRGYVYRRLYSDLEEDSG
jgi:hypothetical protein